MRRACETRFTLSSKTHLHEGAHHAQWHPGAAPRQQRQALESGPLSARDAQLCIHAVAQPPRCHQVPSPEGVPLVGQQCQGTGVDPILQAGRLAAGSAAAKAVGAAAHVAAAEDAAAGLPTLASTLQQPNAATQVPAAPTAHPHGVTRALLASRPRPAVSCKACTPETDASGLRLQLGRCEHPPKGRTLDAHWSRGHPPK